jgi:hypothetical protein
MPTANQFAHKLYATEKQNATMGKRRHTAKTGDKSLYKARSDRVGKVTQDIDVFHDERDQEFLKLDGKHEPDDSDESVQDEAVMNLDSGGSSSGDESEAVLSSNDDSNDERSLEDQPEADTNDSSSDDDDDDDSEMEDVRDWGKQKSAYYHGDTADLELGQDEDDAYLEEEAAKQLQAARYKNMEEDDFVLTDMEVEAKRRNDTYEGDDLSLRKDITKLPAKDKRKFLDRQHPELLPLLNFFSGSVKDLAKNTSVATKALFDSEPGIAAVRSSNKDCFCWHFDRLRQKPLSTHSVVMAVDVPVEKLVREYPGAFYYNPTILSISHAFGLLVQLTHSISCFALNRLLELHVPVNSFY